jgi:hypothetical protein
MSKRTVEQALMRALSDAEFRAQLRDDPKATLKGWDLTDAEREAILRADTAALLDYGVDKRLVHMLPPGIYQA